MKSQCKKCRYSFLKRGVLQCRKIEVQQCIHRDGKQMLLAVPGDCGILNADGNCEKYRPRLFIAVAEVFSRGK